MVMNAEGGVHQFIQISIHPSISGMNSIWHRRRQSEKKEKLINQIDWSLEDSSSFIAAASRTRNLGGCMDYTEVRNRVFLESFIFNWLCWDQLSCWFHLFWGLDWFPIKFKHCTYGPVQQRNFDVFDISIKFGIFKSHFYGPHPQNYLLLLGCNKPRFIHLIWQVWVY